MADKNLFEPSDAAGRPAVPDLQPGPTRLALAPADDYRHPAGAQPPERAPTRLDSLYPLRVIYKRRWLAGTVLALVVLGAAIHSLTLVPVYEARVRVLIENERMNLVKFQDVMEADRTSSVYYQTQFMILQSRSLARKTIATLRQSGGFDAAPAETGPPPLTFSNALSRITGVFSSSKANPPSAVASVSTAPAPKPSASVKEATDAEVDRFLAGLTITPVAQSRLVDVKYRSTVPALAMRYANAVVAAYIDQNLESKFLATQQATDWLTSRLSEQRQKVEAAEQTLQRFRERTGVIATDPSDDIAVQKLDSIATAVTNARAARIEKEALYKQAEAVQRIQASAETLPAVLSNTYVQQLKGELVTLQGKLAQLSQDLGDKHPDVVATRNQIQLAEAKLRTEAGKVVESLRSQFIAAQAAENSLDASFQSQKRQALAMNRTGLDLAVLQREAESNRQIYDMLTQRAKETDLAGDIKTNNVRIVDPAEVPRAPSGANRMTEVRSAAMWGLVLAIGLAFLLEYMDSRIKTPEDLAQLYDVPFLGMLPTIPNSPHTLFLHSDAHGHFAEALRRIRTNVLFSGFEAGSRSLLITSAGKGEGKSAVSSNLAVALAQLGSRVLLIDADMRRPSLQTVFKCAKAPGLADLLAGARKGNEVVVPSGVNGLWLLPAGTIPPNPAELLGSERFKKVLRHAEEGFDWVIVDSPPIMPVTDSTLIAHETSAVLFVAAADITTRHAAVSSLETLDKVGARIIGTVLNRVDVIRNPYYYQSTYRKDYGYYAAASNG